ncbi:MAG: aminofutalosine synthase MqnE, partial [Planctomycetaceae bacterium]|nr:aminofutalosine synthase MqnE [Planctomycetaceae bacterium]
MIFSVDPRLKPIRDKIESGERLSLDDGLLMYDLDIPVNDLGQLANLVRERKNG